MRRALDLLVGEPGRDLGRRVEFSTLERVGLAGRRCSRGAEAERDHVDRHDPDQQRAEEADPQPAAGQPDEDAGVGDPADRAGRAADGDRDETRDRGLL